MMDVTIPAAPAPEDAAIDERWTQLITRLLRWTQDTTPGMGELEDAVLRISKEFAQWLLALACSQRVPRYADPVIACACGGQAQYQRRRTVTSQTLFGPIRVTRPYYLCPVCHQGHSPIDTQLGLVPGRLSPGLAAVTAFLGATGPFAEAATVLEMLTLVHLSPTVMEETTEAVGAAIAVEDDAAIAAAWADTAVIAPPPATGPARLYISMDGTMTHSREEGWTETRVAALYTTKQFPPAPGKTHPTIRATDISYYADRAAPQHFGRGVWLEAVRRGVQHAREVIVLGDGAAWLWNQADEHFPHATQIVDWFHATAYVWTAAHAMHGDSTPAAQQWATARVAELADGNVAAVIAACEPYQSHALVEASITYFRNNQSRMAYDVYRQRGLHIGSGTIESACKHVLGARLKQAGMRWAVRNLRLMAKVRARLKSGRWAETIAALPARQRTYSRKAALPRLSAPA